MAVPLFFLNCACHVHHHSYKVSAHNIRTKEHEQYKQTGIAKALSLVETSPVDVHHSEFNACYRLLLNPQGGRRMLLFIFITDTDLFAQCFAV